MRYSSLAQPLCTCQLEKPFRFLIRTVVFMWGIFVQSLLSCPGKGRSPPLIMMRWKNRKKMVEDPSLSVLKVVVDPEEPLLGIQFDNHSLVDNSLGVKLAFLDYICVWWPVYWFLSLLVNLGWRMNDAIVRGRQRLILYFLAFSLSFELLQLDYLERRRIDVEQGVHRKM